MTDRERIMLGAIGGGLVALIGYPIPAYESIVVFGGVGLIVGLVIRGVGFAFLGGLWAYMHRQESNRFRVFQLGLLGPAIVSAMVSGNAQRVEVSPADFQPRIGMQLIAPAYGAEESKPGTARPVPSTWDIIIRGILGTTVVKPDKK